MTKTWESRLERPLRRYEAVRDYGFVSICLAYQTSDLHNNSHLRLGLRGVRMTVLPPLASLMLFPPSWD